MVAEDDFPPAGGTGTIERADLYEEFQRYALGFIDPERDPPDEGSSSTAATAWPGR